MSEKYLILIVEDPAIFDTFTADDWQRHGERHGAFVAAVEADGATILATDPLDAPTSSSRIYPPGSMLTDGPYPETKEVMLGYYTLEVADSAQARRLAEQCPTVGWVELRRVNRGLTERA